MSDYLTEEEQVELLKSWAKQYGLVILSGIAIAIVLMTGWRYWKERQHRILSQASAQFDVMLTTRAQNDIESTDKEAKQIIKKYPKTIYSEVAALMIARNAVMQKNYGLAKEKLQSVIAQSHSSSLRQIARLRLARVILAENKPEKALEALNKVDNKTFQSLINEVRGDIYLSMNKAKQAREHYKLALNEQSEAESLRPVLQMKYDNLATNEVESKQKHS